MFQHQWRLHRLLVALALLGSIVTSSHALADTATDAQSEPLLSQYVRQHWTTTDGLPHNSINHISQDHNGYLWLATWEGPVRFNGRSFEVFNDMRVTGFADNAIYTVTRSADRKQLWFGGGRGSIGYYQQGKWHPQAPLPPFVNDIQPHATDGIWVATNVQGLIWQTSAGKRTFYTEAEGLPGNSVFEVSYDHSRHLWVATNQGLAVKAGDASEFVAVGGLPKALVQGLLVSRTGDVWVAIGNTLYRGDLATGFQPYFSALPHSFTNLFEAKDGAIWFGSHTHGVGRFYPSAPSNIDYLGQEHGLANNHVLDIFQDDEDSMWIATHGGLTQLRQAVFQSYSERDGLRGDYVRAITSHTTDSGATTKVWIGTSAGVTRLSSVKDENDHSQQRFDVLELGQGSILSLAVHPAGYLLVGTYTKGLLAFELKPDGEHEISANFSTSNLLRSNEVRQLQILSDGTILVGTSSGVTRIIAPFEQPVATHLAIPQGLPNQYITALHHDPLGTPNELWIGTVSGLVHIANAREKIHDLTNIDLRNMYRANASAALGLPELMFDIDHNELGIWVATDRGLLFMPRAANGNLSQPIVYLFNRDTGLPTDKFFSVKALHNEVWLGTSNGAIKLPLNQLDEQLTALRAQQPVQQTYQHFGATDGFINSQLNSGGPALHLTDHDELWFATAGGVTRVALPELAQQYQQAPPPRPYIETAHVNHQPITTNAELTANSGRVDFTFVGIGYRNPEQIRYQVRLLGFQDQWEPRGRLGYVEYTALPAGAYEFQVRAAYPSGNWSEPASFSFYKQAGVTSHWLFWLLAAATLTFIGYLSVAWRIKALANAKAKLSELVAEQTHELNQLAREDVLTKLANRRAFDERLQQELERAQRYPRSLCVAIIDIDFFKAVNDIYLHDVGDYVLQQVGATLKTAVREVDFVARWGGEEFSVLLPDTDLAAATLVCERIREQIAALEFPQASLKITVSIGLADNTRTNDRRLLVKLADQALYAAKHQGRNQVCVAASKPSSQTDIHAP